MGKRLFDLAASLLLLIPALPLMLLAAIAVRLESPGPAFHRQRCVGLYGQDLWLVQLRSTPMGEDSRITRVGRILRMLGINKLPRLWAVLTGRMSFVGPRPERPQFVTEQEKGLPYYAERHVMRPGITGWAQINAPKGAEQSDAREKLEYDLYYAKNCTIFLDILILFQSMRGLLWPEGAR